MNKQDETIRSLLYLHAVIPALEMLVRIDPESLAIAKDLTSPLRLLVGSHEQRILTFENGTFSCTREPVKSGGFTLWFPTAHQFIKLMESRGIPFLIPSSGWLSVGTLKAFSSLMKRLESYLKPADIRDLSEHEVACRVHLQLAVATASAPILCLLDPVSVRELRSLPAGIAVFSCDPTLPSCWVRVKQGLATSGMGATPEPCLAEINFTTPRIGYEALGERLDQMAAVNTGKIKVKGLIPLADGLDLVLARVSRYLPTT